MQAIIPGLYLGSALSARGVTALRAAGITHVLSLAGRQSHLAAEGFEHLEMHVDDVPHVHIDELFDKGCDFIAAALDLRRRNLGRSGGVLVHCRAGISRSPTIVCAFLMRDHRMRYRAAMDTIVAARPAVRPNDGFIRQLRRYDAELRRRGWFEDDGGGAAGPRPESWLESQSPTSPGAAAAATATAAVEAAADADADVEYLCVRCRRVLFRKADLVPHEPQRHGHWDARKRWRGGDGGPPADAAGQCTSLFLDQMDWMGVWGDAGTGADGHPTSADAAPPRHSSEGKLACPKCGHRVGTFHWQGAQCSCGAWVTPAFQVVKSRVDERRPLAALPRDQ